MAELPAPNPDAEIWHRWKSELDFAQKDKKYVEWVDRCEKIVKRYRDEREGNAANTRRLNILWSNIQTLQPATYARAPKPVVERRFMDRDPAARLASLILERALNVQMEVGYYYRSTKQANLDWLLTAMGQTWIRYEPQFEPSEVGTENKRIEGEEKTAESIEENGDGAPYEKLSSERVCVDYVFWRDFLWGPSRFWGEVPWVAKRSWLTRSEIAEKFYGGDLAKAKAINLDFTPDRMRDVQNSDTTETYFKKAEVWEIWNKADQTVYFVPPGTPSVVLKKEPKPVLKLEGFWPCPEPLFATQTNDTLVPVPDYVEYQDQAYELDDLTGRIAALTTALRANGVYDASVPALARLLQAGQDNKLIPVDQWAMFAEKGGMKGAVDLLPIKEIADVLIGLYQARSQVKNDLFEVTGMSDIVRGQSETGAKTATEQRIKGQFASMRLEDRRAVQARFCRDNLAIMAEIISEMFSDESLMQMSGYQQIMQDDVRKAVEAVPPPQEPQLPEGAPPPPPELQQQMQMEMQQQFQMAQQQAAQQAQQKAMGEFQAALQILRSDKLRGFRVDIETDSTIAVDAETDKQASVELMKGTVEAMMGAGQVAMQAPELMGPLGDLLMFTFRRFRVGRTVEASLEDALDQIKEKIEAAKGQPPRPSPEEIKANAEIESQKMEDARKQKEGEAKLLELEEKRKMAKEEHDYRMAELEKEAQIADAERQNKAADQAIQAQYRDADRAAKAEERDFKREDRELARQGEIDKQSFAREQHDMKIADRRSEASAKATEAGLPGDEAWTGMLTEMREARAENAELTKALLETVVQQGENIKQLAAIAGAESEVTTPDGRRFRSRKVMN